MADLELDYSNTAAYSPREGTVAAKWVDLYIPDNGIETIMIFIWTQICHKSNINIPVGTKY